MRFGRAAGANGHGFTRQRASGDFRLQGGLLRRHAGRSPPIRSSTICGGFDSHI